MFSYSPLGIMDNRKEGMVYLMGSIVLQTLSISSWVVSVAKLKIAVFVKSEITVA